MVASIRYFPKLGGGVAMDHKEKVFDRFIRYVQVDTKSILRKKGEEPKKPSSEGQLMLGAMIKTELRQIGIDATLMEFENGSFLLQFPESPGYEKAPHAVFAAHLDTYPEFPGGAKPVVHTYNGGDIVLSKGGVIIPAADLVGLEGKQIVTADGTTLLGADDKAGVAALVTTMEMLLGRSDPYGPHGKVSFWFCVDEEIGELDISVVPEDVVRSWNALWTVDGERLGPIDIGCFVCRMMPITFRGVDAHPGVDGGKLRPAHYAASDFVHELSLLPTPMKTSGVEPFYYAVKVEGNASKTTVLCAPRTFRGEESDEMSRKVHELAQASAEKYGCTVEMEDNLVCVNTRAGIEAKMELIAPGLDAHRQFGFEPKLEDVRGGTDGAMVNKTYPQLPAPNMGTGAKNLHGPREFLVVEELQTVPAILIETILGYAKINTE